MPDRPYYRTCRQFFDGSYASSGQWEYIEHPFFANDPDKFVRPFFLIQKDLQKIFEFVDPDDQNRNTYSFRMHELLMRTCIEVEANLKAILTENDYSSRSNLTMKDYCKIEASHLLSGYKILVPYWRGQRQIRTPFQAWATGGKIPWYQAYNATKHDRHVSFSEATFDHLIEAICGLVALLSAQFYTCGFSPGAITLAFESANYGFEDAIGNYFGVKFPSWPDHEKYTFGYDEWQALIKAEANPFLQYPYPPP